MVTGTATSTFNGPITSASGDFIIAGNSANDVLLNPYGGNVGIGTMSPTEMLHVSLEDATNYSPAVIMTSIPGILLENTSNNNDGVAQISFKGNAAGAWNAAIGAEGNSDTAELYFQVDNAGTIKEALRLQADGDIEIMNGNVGIGTTTPGQLLSVNGNGYFAGNLTFSNTTNTH